MRISKIGKRFASFLLAGVLVAGLFPCTALASAATEQSDLVKEFVDKGKAALELFYKTDNTDDFGGSDAYLGTSKYPGADAVFPEALDLRDRGTVTPVKRQNPWGTCWSFGAIAAAETSIMNDLDMTVASAGALDFSELHTAWFSFMPLPEGSGSQAGEGNYPADKEGNFTKNPKVVFNIGGLPATATSVFSSGVGLVTESQVPYKNKEDLKTIEENKDWCYASEGDWSVDESLRFSQAFPLLETSILPTPAGRNEAGEYVYNKAATSAIKQELTEGRAVEIGFSADLSMPQDIDPEPQYLNVDTWAHYTWDVEAPENHLVTIVGWDDTYSKDHFLKDHQPAHDGAWIVKNSWGSKTEPSPNKNPAGWGLDGEGFFYLSYYDTSLRAPETFKFDTNNYGQNADYRLIDQYDYLPSLGAVSHTSPDPLAMANVFVAEEDQVIHSLSCETTAPDTKVTYELYLLDDQAQSPTDGKRLATKTQTYHYGGFHRTFIEEAPRVKAGQRYSVVVTEEAEDGYVVLMDRAVNKDGMEFLRGKGHIYYSYGVGIVNPKESYSFDGTSQTWTDWSDTVSHIKAASAQAGVGYYDYDNFPIKAYADPANLNAALQEAKLQGKTEGAAYSS
ncbi:MAG: C1 family peptidase, partial [Citrobacter sp.]